MASAKAGTTSTSDTLRVLLVGKSGSGKSSSGNTILGRKELIAKADGKSVTRHCSKVETDADGRPVAIVDAPGLFDTSLSNEEIITETYKSISLLAPGPHAFLLVLQIGRFTAEEKGTVEYVKNAFGKGAEKYIIVLFTRGDDLEEDDKTIEEYLKDADASLKKLLAECGNRYHVFNNREKKDRTQVTELLKKIDGMVKENGGSYYSSEMLQEAEEAIQKEKERIMKEKEEERKRREEDIKRTIVQEMEEKLQLEQQTFEEEKKRLEEEFSKTQDKIKNEHEIQEMEQRMREFRNQMSMEVERKVAEEVAKIRKDFERKARKDAESNISFRKLKKKALAFFSNLFDMLS